MEVVASLSQGRTAAAQCGLFTYKSVPVIFEPPCILFHILTPLKSTRKQFSSQWYAIYERAFLFGRFPGFALCLLGRSKINITDRGMRSTRIKAVIVPLCTHRSHMEWPGIETRHPR